MSAEVAAALAAGRPVVALESTIISHGMPFPQNLDTARQVEAVVRAHGAVPATIAVLRGVLHVGLTAAQLERLARAGSAVRKVSRRDLPLVMALHLDGATTVSATMLLAARAGIAVFVTGGGFAAWWGWWQRRLCLVSTSSLPASWKPSPPAAHRHAAMLSSGPDRPARHLATAPLQASAACTAAASAAWTSLPISPSWGARRWRWCAPGPSLCWTSLAPWNS